MDEAVEKKPPPSSPRVEVVETPYDCAVNGKANVEVK